MNIFNQIQLSALEKKKLLAVLLDPDKIDNGNIAQTLGFYSKIGVDFLFIGGSLLISSNFAEVVKKVKSLCDIPIVLFPGSVMQVSDAADAILFLSLISGRNADLLIGQHVLAAPTLKKSSLEIIPTGYMLVDGGKSTTAHYVSQSLPIPKDKPEIAACTAMAGEMLGLKLMYLDAGSGADLPVSAEMIEAVKNSTNAPLIVGGGIRTKEGVNQAFDAGADVVVIGNSLEKNPALLEEMMGFGVI